jgi:hypothetical protein
LKSKDYGKKAGKPKTVEQAVAPPPFKEPVVSKVNAHNQNLFGGCRCHVGGYEKHW